MPYKLSFVKIKFAFWKVVLKLLVLSTPLMNPFWIFQEFTNRYFFVRTVNSGPSGYFLHEPIARPNRMIKIDAIFVFIRIIVFRGIIIRAIKIINNFRLPEYYIKLSQ